MQSAPLINGGAYFFIVQGGGERCTFPLMDSRTVRILYIDNGSGKLIARVTLPAADIAALNFPIIGRLTSLSKDDEGGPAWVLEPEEVKDAGSDSV